MVGKYAESCCPKTTWAIILMTLMHLLDASCVPVFTQQQGGWITVHKRWLFLKEQLGAVYIIISKTQCAFTGIELEFVH